MPPTDMGLLYELMIESADGTTAVRNALVNPDPGDQPD